MFGFNPAHIDTFWEILGFSLLVTFITWLLSRVLRFLIVKIIKYKNKKFVDETALIFLRSSVKMILGVLAIFYIIYTIPVLRNKALLIISGAGVFAAIIGFVAQSALANLVSGVFIVVFKPFRVGDYIKLDDKRLGIVSDITLRHTIINNFENKRLIIPNSIISKESILNHTIEDSQVLTFNNFILGMYADIDLARKIIEEEAAKLPNIIDKRTDEQKAANDPIVNVRVVNTKESVIHMRAYVWIDGPNNEFSNKSVLREAVHKRFIKEGVNLPIPLRKIIKN
jgi:small-conductance mechanosensitive channel